MMQSILPNYINSKHAWRNSLRLFAILFVTALGLILGSPALSEAAQAPALGEIRLVESNAHHVVIELAAPRFTINERRAGGKTFAEIVTADWNHTDGVGKPQLPSEGKLVAIPQGANISVHILADKTRQQSLNHPVLPVPTARVSQGVNDRLPKYLGDDYIPNSKVYSTSAPYPSEIVSSSAPAQWRSQRFISIQFHPFQFNPVTKQLTIHDTMRVEIDFGLDVNATGAQLGTSVDEGTFEIILQNSLVNYESSRAWRTTRRPAAHVTHAESAAVTGNAYKISVNADGIYKVTCEALAAAGLAWNTVTLDTLKLSFLGNEVALDIADNGDNHCGNGEYFLFFGQKPTDPIIPYNVYWLTFGGGAGKRMVFRNVSGGSVPTSYPRTQQFRTDVGYATYAPWIEDADHWVSCAVNVGAACSDISINLDDLAAGTSDGTLRVRVSSGAQANPFSALDSVVSSNGVQVFEKSWNSGETMVDTAAVNNLVD